MKKILFLFTLLMSMISNSYGAWTFQGKGRLINAEQHLGVGTLGGGLVDKTGNLSVSKNVWVNAIALSAKQNMNSTFNAFGQHNISIRNNTHKVQDYTYAYQLCVDHSKCMYYSGNIELNPGAIGQHHVTSYVTVQLSLKGTYLSEAKTQIKGRQSAFHANQGLITID